MRTRRQRVFRVTINGIHQWTEDAGSRSVFEFHHNLSTGKYVGCSVRVQEQFLGGAKVRVLEDEEEL